MTNYVDKWEYCREAALTDKQLAKYGQRGWELVCVTQHGYHYFKRPTGEAVDTNAND